MHIWGKFGQKKDAKSHIWGKLSDKKMQKTDKKIDKNAYMGKIIGQKSTKNGQFIDQKRIYRDKNGHKTHTF